MVFWAVSNCETMNHRERYAEKLQEYVDVDVYSRKECLRGSIRFDCPHENEPVHNHNNANCFTNISTQYWFYLAFENSICNDYITEKFWRSLDLEVVPIVMGGGNYTRDAPENVICSCLIFTTDAMSICSVQFLNNS